MGEKTNFLLEGDIIPMTEDDIDNIESLYVPSGDTTGSNITSEDIVEKIGVEKSERTEERDFGKDKL